MHAVVASQVAFVGAVAAEVFLTGSVQGQTYPAVEVTN